ncbi:hypothetical protein DID80_03095 [Candidatus Marinamargulisbacteria bacterium SCGC AAA071-K20]|nr:hypothetical protein DID80_03095 [Candidatus Marinamargulisbacteria bacterium SCGC AAA071-K20]
METIFFTFILLLVSMTGIGIGVLFFGKNAERSACGSVPEAAHEDCPSQKAGLCPIEDKTGALKMANMSKLSH